MDGFKKVFFYAVRSYKKIISIFIIIIFILILLAASLYQIKIDDGTFKEDEWSNTPYVASTYTSSANIGSNGITTDSTAKDLWDKSIKEGSNIKEYLDSPEELEKLMNAELITQYPKIDTAKEGAINGIIEFERNKTDGTNCKLKYLDKEKFDTYVNSNSITTSEGTSILDYFTIDDSGNAVVAVINKDTYQITSDDGDITIGKLEEDGFTIENLNEENKKTSDSGVEYSNVVYNVISVPINYKDAVQKYTMPFQYLWSLLVMSNDKDFVLELADLVESSEIKISLYDNVTTYKNVDVYNYKKQTRIDKYAKVSVKDDYGVKGYITERYWVSSESPHPEVQYYNSKNEATYITGNENKVTITTINENNNFQYYLTKADVWITDYSREYEFNAGNTTETENSVNLDDTAYVFNANTSKNSNEQSSLLNDGQAIGLANSVKRYIENEVETEEEIEIEVSVSYVSCKNYDRKIERKRTITNYETQQKYVEGNVVNNPKVEKKSDEDNFVKILCKKEHKGAKKALTNEVSSWFFEILEKNPDTVNMVDLTKYLFYKATGKDYGVTDFDFSIYSVNNFQTIEGGGSSDQLIRYLHYWENADGAPTNADGTKYIIEDDGAGHPTVGYGVDIFNSGYLGVFLSAGYSESYLRQFGGEVDKELVDSIEEMEIAECTKSVSALSAELGLTGYQKNALISRYYNYNIKGFKEAYTAYWKKEDDQFEQKNPNANFNHQLYTNYMSKPVTSEGEYMPGLGRRRKSEWILFQTGYYYELNEWHIEGGSIIQVAKEIHEYMEQNKYSYCVYGTNGSEECGKSTANGSTHGLNRTFEESKTGFHHSCCATYVSWVLQKAGYLNDSEHTDGANSLQNLLTQKGWIRISSESDLQAGDVLCYNNHVEIYAGDNKIYNSGSGNAIRNSSPQNRTRKFSYALRAPN